MRPHRLIHVLASVLLLTSMALGEDDSSSELVERAQTRLVQLDVTVTGPAHLVEQLRPEDVELTVDGKRIRDLFLDHICPGSEDAEPSLRIPANYVLYFDQAFLTQAGRAHVLSLARDAIPLLVNEHDRAMVMSSGRNLESYTGLTNNAGELLAAIDAIEADPSHWLPFAADDASLWEMGRALSAYESGEEEHWPSERRLERLATVLGFLTDVESPKVLLYFADTLGLADRAQADVIESANTHGVRIVAVPGVDLGIMRTVTAEAKDSPRRSRSEKNSFINQLNQRSRVQLRALARPTGGDAVMGGVLAGELVDSLHSEMRCFTLISFEAEDFSEDQPLAVALRSTHRKVKLQTRDTLVVQSRSERSTSRLLAAFAVPDLGDSQVPVRLGLLPIDHQDGHYSALIQIGVDGSTIADTVWDLGATVLASEQVRDQFSGRVTVSGKGVPVILEKLVRFKPGPFEIASVANETNALDSFQLIGTERLEGEWPRLAKQLEIVGPISIVQTTEGVFVRDGESRITGSRLIAEPEPLQGDRPAWALTLLCGSRKGKQAFRVLHGMEGSSPVETVIEPGGECVQLRDRIDTGSMGPGTHNYVVTISIGDETISQTVRQVLGPDVALSSGSGGAGRSR